MTENRQALLTALTTEHFTLQGARSTTVSENTGRSSLYLTAVSSALVALGFMAQVSNVGDTFRLFSLAVIPVLFWLGLLSFVRVLERRSRTCTTRARSTAFATTTSTSRR